MLDLNRLLLPLEQVARDGASRAGRGLSGLMGQEIVIDVPSVRIGSRGDACSAVGGDDAVVLGAYLEVFGELTGHVMLLFPIDRALQCVDLMCGEAPGTMTVVDDMVRSAVGELGNIVGSAFINALGDLTNFALNPAPPLVVQDIAGALVDTVYAEVLSAGGDIVMIDTVFEDRAGRTAGLLMVAPDPESLRAIERVAA